MKKCYSINEEDFHLDSVDEAVSALLDDTYLRTGETATLWEADALQHPASYYLGNIAEDMTERASAEVGEYADGWDFSHKEAKSLQDAVSATVDEWATANRMQPCFWIVENVIMFTVRFIDDKGGFEIVSKD